MIKIVGGPSATTMRVYANDVDISNCVSELILVAKPGYLNAAYVKLVPVEVEIDAKLMEAIRKEMVPEKDGTVDVTPLGATNHWYRMKRNEEYGE